MNVEKSPFLSSPLRHVHWKVFCLQGYTAANRSIGHWQKKKKLWFSLGQPLLLHSLPVHFSFANVLYTEDSLEVTLGHWVLWYKTHSRLHPDKKLAAEQFPYLELLTLPVLALSHLVSGPVIQSTRSYLNSLSYWTPLKFPVSCTTEGVLAVGLGPRCNGCPPVHALLVVLVLFEARLLMPLTSSAWNPFARCS